MSEPDLADRQPHWPGTVRGWAVDAGLAAAVIAAEAGGSHAAGSWGHLHHTAPGVLAYLLLTAGGLALLARRRYPVGVLASTAVKKATMTANQVTLAPSACAPIVVTKVMARTPPG